MDRTANLLGAAALLLSDAVLAAATEAAGRSGAAGAALSWLAQEPACGIEQLRRPLGLSQSATVRVVDALEADGLARRSPGLDARSIRVELTAAGRRAARAVQRRRASVVDVALASLSASEQATLTGLLEKMLAALTTDGDHAERVCRLCDWTSCPDPLCPVGAAGREKDGLR
jgi:MarR family transcriptional regulator, negative regulator of the multidrug operon emrRAB